MNSQDVHREQRESRHRHAARVAGREEEWNMPRMIRPSAGARWKQPARLVRLIQAAALAVLAIAVVGCPTIGAPTLMLSRTAFNFQLDLRDESLTLENNGGGTIEWSVDAADVPEWLDVSPMSGSFSSDIQTLNLSLNAAADAMGPGTFQDEFTVASTGGDVTVSVSLRVTTGGDLMVEPTELDFGAVFDLSTFTIRNGGTEAIDWEIASIDPPDDFLSVDPPTEGTLVNSTQTAIVQVRVNRDGLEAGEYTGTIDVTSDAGSATVSVTMRVEELAPRLSVSPGALEFETDRQATGNFVVRNVGAGTITWTILDDLPPWLTLDTLTDTVSAETDRVTLQVNAATLDPGTYEHTLTIVSENSEGGSAGESTVAVTLVVPEPTPELTVTPLEIDLGETDLESFFQIRNTGTGTLDWTIVVGAPWIVLDEDEPMAGSLTTNNEIIEFQVDRSMLAPGSHETTIAVSSNGGNVLVAVRVEVLPATLQVVPRILNFSSNATEKQIAIFNQGTGTVTWSVDTTSVPDWLRDDSNAPLFSQTSGSVAGEETDGITIGVNRLGQAPGSYEFEFAVASDAGDIPVLVLMEVAEDPVLSIDTGRNVLDDTPNVDLDGIPFVPVGFGQSATFTIQNVGTGTLSWMISNADFPEWLSLDELGPEALVPADGPFTVTVNITRGNLPFGPYSHRIFVQSNDNNNTSQPIDIQMNVPKRVVIRAAPEDLDFGTTGTTLEMLVANFGDPDTVLNFGISSNKNWLFAFPETGRSIGVVNPELNADFQSISVSIDRTGLDGAGGGTGVLTIFAADVRQDRDDIDNDGNITEVIQVRDDSIAPPLEVEVAVQAAELFFEAPPARLRVPSLVRYIATMRNLRFNSIALPDADLPDYVDNFFISETDVPLEITESNQFLTSSSLLTNDVVILLDYSASTFEAALLAQQHHAEVTQEFLTQFPTAVLPDFSGFADADDPLQFIYEQCVGQLLRELPPSHNILITEFHDRNQPLAPIIGFTPNEGAGHDALIAALESINITDHGASDMLFALELAAATLAAENSPVPSTGPVIPSTAFDDADLRTILMFSDGRFTASGDPTLTETISGLAAVRARLLSVAWGEDFNAGPLASIAADTGGHVYVTRALDTGALPGDGIPVRVPSIYTMYDWCHTDLANDPCDLSIGQDVRSEIVLSYVSLEDVEAVEGRVSASFDDPNDGNEEFACRLPDQGEIAGEFSQELNLALAQGDTNLGQMAIESMGIDASDQATVYLYADYIPRDLVTLEFVVALNAPGSIDASLTSISGVGLASGGFFDNAWTVEQIGGPFVDPITGLESLLIEVNTNGAPMQYGAFGRLLRFEFDAPGGAPFTFRLLDVIGTTRNSPPPPNVATKPFVHPDGILVDSMPFKAPSFPTPRVTPTILNFGTSSSTEFFTVENVGGSWAEGGVLLDWRILGAPNPNEDVTVVPGNGLMESTEELFTVRVDLDRNKPEVGIIDDLVLLFEYDTGIENVGGLFEIVLTGTILPPVLTVTSADFAPGTTTLNFGSAPQNSGVQTLQFTVANTGQSRLIWFRQDANPSWLDVTEPLPVTEEFPQTVFVNVNRETLAPGSSATHDMILIGTTADGQIVGSTTVTVNVDVDP